MHKCPYCRWIGERSDFELDHMDPSLKTESLILDFLRGKLELICSGCNRQKGEKTSEEYVVWRLLFADEANFGPIRAKSFLDILRQRAYTS